MIEIPSILSKKIITFLQDLPLIYDKGGRLGLLLEANLDQQLLNMIPHEDSTGIFFQQLVQVVVKYGQIHDGRSALEAVLEAAKNRVGRDKQAYCDTLLTEWHAYLHKSDHFQCQDSSQSIHANTGVYQAVTSQEWKELGISDTDIANEMMKLDYEQMDELTEVHEGTMEMLMGKWNKYPETGKIILYNQREPVGYWTFVPLFDEIFEQFKAGKGFDTELTDEIIELIEDPGIYHLYFIGINLKEKHNHIKVRKLLFSSFLESLEELAKEGVFFEDMCANAFTQRGKAMCHHFDMAKIADHCDKGEIYYRYLYPFPDSGLVHEKQALDRLYASKFGSIRG